MNTYQDAAVFELAGDSHDAALHLYATLTKTGQIGSFNPKVRTVFENHAAARFSSIGQNAPALQVYKDANGNLAAYEEAPLCFASSFSKDLKFILVCPKNYRGEHFTPAHGNLLSDGKRDRALWEVGQTSSSILPSFFKTTSVPGDFDESIHIFRNTPGKYQFIEAWISPEGTPKP